MSYNSIISNKNNELLSTSWTAGTNKIALPKLFKRHEIESVNVPETCEKIRKAITEQLQDQTLTSNNLDCRASNGIPFRIATNLCYGTLRLYQQQVQNLLECTQNFFAYSSFKVKEIIATKRSSSLENENTLKRRRLETSKNSGINFSELLHEAEDIQNWTENQMEESITQVKSTTVENQVLNCLHSTRLHIREITIREVNIDYNVPEIDNCAFGNATAEELQEFLNVSGDKESETFLPESFKEKINKRKISFEQEYDEIVTPKCPKISNDKTLSEDRINNSAERFEIQNDFDENLNSNSVLVSSQASKHLDEVAVGMPFADTSIEVNLDLGNHISPEKNTSPAFKTSISKTKNQSKNGIKDKLIKLPKEQYSNQFKHYKEKQCITLEHIRELPKTNFEDICKFLPIKPSRKCIISRSHNLKLISNSRNHFVEYIDILNDIFDYSVDNNLAAEICPIASSDNGGKRKRRANKNFNLNEEIYSLSQTDINNNFRNIVENNNDSKKNLFLTSETAENDTKEEYGPYNVMMKLLDIMRNNPDEIIKANNFLRNIPTNRQEAALTLYSLLELVKQKLIVISKKENSCEMEIIDLGPASVRLIQNLRV